MSSTEDRIEKVVIIGSGPAGWTAAIYAARANLDPLCIVGVPRQDPAPVLPGGQLMLTTEVENYPGFPEGVTGPEMMQMFQKQAERFGTRVLGADVDRCEFGERPFTLHLSNGDVVRTHSVIIATGATANWLGLENELRLATTGGGVSACAVCDGALPIFRGKPLVVIGGGDTACEEASYLSKYGSSVTMLVRRNVLRASKAMQHRVFSDPKITIMWHTEAREALGEQTLTGVRVQNNQTREETIIEASGLFYAIGHQPNTEFLETQLTTDETGYVITEPDSTRTNVAGVFACGDVKDKVFRQAVTAAGSGCMAALEAQHYLVDLKDLQDHTVSQIEGKT